jgi:fucose permease
MAAVTTLDAAAVRRGRIASLAAFVAFGVAISALGPSLPGLRRSLGIGDVGAGVLIAIQGGAFGISVFLAGLASDRVGRRVPLVVGTVLLALGTAALAASPSRGAAFASSVAMGAGAGAIDAAVSSLAVDVGGERPGRELLLLNGALGIGALVGPAMVALAIHVSGWRLALGLVAGACAAAALLAPLAPHGAPHRAEDRHGARRLLADPRFIALLAVMVLYTPGEFGLVTWFSTYADDVRHMSEAAAAASVVGFWAGLVVSRLGLGMLWAAERPAAVLPLATASASALLLVLLVVPDGAPVIAALLLVGIACGVVFPLILTAAAQHFPRDAGVATGLAVGLAGAGELVLPVIVGGASAAAGTAAAGMVVIACAFASASVATLAYRRTLRTAP